MQHRGTVHASPLGERVVATLHPSAVLRAPDSEGRAEALGMLVDDLKVVARLLKKA
jgi:DNA polymerase